MPMSSEAISVLEDQWESLGEPEVRRLLPSGAWGDPGSDMRSRVEDWLRSKEVERAVDAISIAREANEVARSASATAVKALLIARQQKTLDVIAIITAIVAIVISIIK